MKYLKKLRLKLNLKRKGFMAITHVLLSLSIMFAVMLIPLDFFQTYFHSLLRNPLLLFFTVVVFMGFSILPDLDGSKSLAGTQLGIVGRILTVFMQSTSGIIWSIVRLRGDRPPMTQHRYLWHTPLIFLSMLGVFYYGIPQEKGNIFTTISSQLQSKPLMEVLSRNSLLVFFVFISFCAITVGSALVLKFIKKFIRVENWMKYVLSGITLSYLLLSDYQVVHQIAVVSVFGYIFHILEDAICDNGIPLLFPIPLGSQIWKKIKLLPITVTTGGNINNIINIIATILLPIIIFYVISRG